MGEFEACGQVDNPDFLNGSENKFLDQFFIVRIDRYKILHGGAPYKVCLIIAAGPKGRGGSRRSINGGIIPSRREFSRYPG